MTGDYVKLNSRSFETIGQVLNFLILMLVLYNFWLSLISTDQYYVMSKSISQ